MNKIIDSNGRLFGLISILDVIVIALVGVLALTLVIKQDVAAPTTQATTSGTPVTYTISVRNILDELAEDIVVGDAIFDLSQSTSGDLGTITKVEITPAVRSASLSDGTIGQALAPGYSDVIITVEATCTIVDGQYRFNSSHVLGLNANRNFYTQFVAFTGLVTSMG